MSVIVTQSGKDRGCIRLEVNSSMQKERVEEMPNEVLVKYLLPATNKFPGVDLEMASLSHTMDASDSDPIQL